MQQRWHAFFSGSVQGVGFRYTVRDMADRLHLAGWVKNLPDGRVELWVEGEEERLNDLLAEIKNAFHVTNEQMDRGAFSGIYSDFLIKY
jgi:acylphosphatase